MPNHDRMYSSILNSIKHFAASSQDEKKALGLRIRAYRANYRLTQEDLAKRLDVARMQIMRWETGKNMPSKVFMKILQREGII